MIPVADPTIGEEEEKLVLECIRSGWISVKSEWVDKFEKKFAKKVADLPYGVAVNSGTSALHLALVVAGIGVGDEVIVPDFSMIAVHNSVKYVGATPVLVDSVSEKDWNIDTCMLSRAVSNKTKAIIVVHTYGFPVDMNRVVEFASRHKLIVIEDCAEAMGAKYMGKLVGSIGDFGCYSLYVNKTITTGQGGVIVTKRKKDYLNLLRIRHHDFGVKRHFRHDRVGYSYGMSGLQAAFGLAQLDRFDNNLSYKISIAGKYKRELEHISDLSFPEVKNEVEPTYWMTGVVFKNERVKKYVQRCLGDSGVETRDFFVPAHEQKAYAGCKFIRKDKVSVSSRLMRLGLLLPSGPRISMDEVERVINAIKSSINAYQG